MKLVIGCPVRKRAWAIPSWYEHIFVACDLAGVVDPTFVFVVDPKDHETVDAIGRGSFNAELIEVAEPYREDWRQWNEMRWTHLANLRNRLLGRVRELAPDAFWSVDSDIMVHPDSLKLALELLEQQGFGWDAVGSKCYMTPTGTECPSYGMFGRERMSRFDAVGPLTVDIIMAIKLMAPTAYAVDYKMDLEGEDIGWSRNCREARVSLGWDGRVCSKHVMGIESAGLSAADRLHQFDKRCGF